MQSSQQAVASQLVHYLILKRAESLAPLLAEKQGGQLAAQLGAEPQHLGCAVENLPFRADGGGSFSGYLPTSNTYPDYQLHR